MENVMETIVNFVDRTKFNDLPKYVTHEMKRLILDSIGCAIAGYSTGRGKIAAELALKLGGRPESTILGTHDKVSSADAAWANGELMNCLDFDAISGIGRHDVPTPVSGVLSVAEGIGASGKDLIVATALGLEVSGRIKSAVEGMHAPGPGEGQMLWPAVNGYSNASLGAAAGVAKLLKLNQEQMANAIGIAGYLCPPNTMRKWIETSPVRMAKYGPPGWGAKTGVTAAMLGEMGYIGDTDLFDGDYGFWRYTGKNKGEWNSDKVIAGIGSKWVAHQINYKQYPCGL